MEPNSAVDVAFISDPDHSWKGKALPVWSERVVIALPENHPLNSQEFVTWDDLKRESLILPLLLALEGATGAAFPGVLIESCTVPEAQRG